MHIWLAPSAYFPHKGGVEEVTAKLGHHLRSQGAVVTIVTNQWPSTLARSDEVDGLPVARLPFVLPGRRPGGVTRYLASRHSLSTQLSRLAPPDLIHLHCVSAQGPALARHARQRRIPLVVTTHGETAMDATRIYQRSGFLRRFLRNLAADADLLTAPSHWTARAAAEIAPSFESAQVIPNGIDPSDWVMTDPPDAPVIAAWGRHVAQKGFDVLVDAFRVVRRAIPNAVLRIGGAGECTDQLRRQAGLGVQFLGPLDRAGVAQMLQGSRIVAVPSRIEPFGVVALEAMASGRRLVYSSVGGLPEVAGDFGRPVTPGDADALATGLIEELTAPPVPVAARTRAASFNWRNVQAMYSTAYEEVLRNAAPSRR